MQEWAFVQKNYHPTTWKPIFGPHSEKKIRLNVDWKNENCEEFSNGLEFSKNYKQHN